MSDSSEFDANMDALADLIDRAERGLIEGTNVTDAWQNRAAYGVLRSDWLAAYVARAAVVADPADTSR